MPEVQDPSPSERRRLLLQSVANAVAAGARVESQSPERAVILRPRLRGLLGRRRQIISIDELGNVLVENV